MSFHTTASFPPTAGWTELPEVEAPLGSIISGQNMWIRGGAMEPRWRLEQAADNILSDRANGAFQYDDIGGIRYPVVTSQDTVAFINDNSYVSLVYVSGTSDFPATGGANDNFFGTSVYLPRRDLNIGVFTNGVDPVFAWGGPSDNTGFSTLTEGPIAADVTLFNNRVVAWNILELSSSSRFVQRVLWSTAGGPEDWTGIGSGSEDLVDMRGAGTRIVATENEMILFSTEEVWRGRRIGGVFTFQFSPISKEIGAPWARAVLPTIHGIFWLGNDYNIYQLSGGDIRPIGNAVQREIRDTIANEKRAFFSYNAELQQLTLYYGVDQSNLFDPDRAFTLHVKADNSWTPQRYPFTVAQSFELSFPSSATTWGGLVGDLSVQSQTYNDLLGVVATPEEALVTSDGTTCFYSDSAGSDLGATVHSQAVFGAVFSGDNQFMKQASRVRFESRADSASSLSVGVSGDGGVTYTETEFALSVQSNTTQQTVGMSVPGVQHQIRVEGDEGRWQLVTLNLDARSIGKVI